MDSRVPSPLEINHHQLPARLPTPVQLGCSGREDSPIVNRDPPFMPLNTPAVTCVIANLFFSGAKWDAGHIDDSRLEEDHHETFVGPQGQCEASEDEGREEEWVDCGEGPQAAVLHAIVTGDTEGKCASEWKHGGLRGWKFARPM